MLITQAIYTAIKTTLFLTSLFCVASLSWADNANQLTLAQGSYIEGKNAFIRLQCNACHTVKGLNLPAAEEMFEVTVELGSSTEHKTSAELLTAIANPSHSLAKGLPISSITDNGNTKMPNFNDIMTVSELIDITTFLKSHYRTVK